MSAPLSRRAMLAGPALVLGAAAAVVAASQAEGQQKISQADAKYQAKPNGTQHCALCVNFRPPNTCRFVQRAIGPNGWCQLFSAKS